MHVLHEIIAEAKRVGDGHAIEEALVTGKDGDNLILDVHGCEASLLEELGHASAAGELLLRRLVQVTAELRERLQLAIGGQVETKRTSDLLHSLDLRRTTDSGNRDTDVNCRALTLEEEVGLEEDLAIGNGDDVGRNVSRDVTALSLDDGKGRKRTSTVLVIELDGALQQTGVQVEDVTRIGFTSRRTTQRQRHLTVGNSLLGEVIIDAEHGATRIGNACRLAVGTVVDEVLAHCATGHGGDVLQRCGRGCGSGHDDRVVHGTMALEGLDHGGDRGGLLADGDVDADHVLALLVDDRVDADGGLARLAVADDQLTLTTSDGNHRVNGDEARLDGLVNRLALDNARGTELDGAIALGLNGALAVQRNAKRIHDTAEQGLAAGYFDDAARGMNLVVLLDKGVVAQKDGTHFVFFKVLGETIDSRAVRSDELEELAGHCAFQTIDARDAVADLDDMTKLTSLDVGLQRSKLLTQDLIDVARGDFRHLPFTSSPY